MNLKKSGLIIVSLLLISMFILSCAPAQPGQQQNLAKQVWGTINYFASLEFVLGKGNADNALIAFMRILIAVLIFAILFEPGRLFLNPNTAIVISSILAIISAIFIPGKILAGIGGAYAVFFSILLIGIPVVGGLYVIWRIPSTSRALIGLKIVIILLLLWILIAVKNHALAII